MAQDPLVVPCRAPRYMLPKTRTLTPDETTVGKSGNAESTSKGLTRLLCRPLSHLWQVRTCLPACLLACLPTCPVRSPF